MIFTNRYDLQMQKFKEYVDEMYDRIHLLIGTESVVATPTGIIVLGKFEFINDGKSAMPRVNMLDSTEGPVEFKVWSKICANYIELCDIVKNYTILYCHIVGFESKILSIDNAEGEALRIASEIREHINNDTINQYKQDICTTEKNIIRLQVYYYGTDRKEIVHNHYEIESLETGERTYVPYRVNKDIFIEDFIFQVANKIPTHLKA